ncbi:MAG: hypothetical protein KGL39_26350 [Patescibacteria group bacterium]|nr:hypothetical protein [Patescibacteria group bacterium]
MRLLPAIALLALATPALAQPAPQPSPYEQSIWKQVAAEHVELFQARANLDAAQAEIAALQQQIAKLTTELAEAKKANSKTPDAPKKD